MPAAQSFAASSGCFSGGSAWIEALKKPLREVRFRDSAPKRCVPIIVRHAFPGNTGLEMRRRRLMAGVDVILVHGRAETHYHSHVPVSTSGLPTIRQGENRSSPPSKAVGRFPSDLKPPLWSAIMAPYPVRHPEDRVRVFEGGKHGYLLVAEYDPARLEPGA